MDNNKIFRFMELLNQKEESFEFVYQYEDWVFRKISGEKFPEKDKRVIYSVHGLTGGIRFLIVVSLMMGANLSLQYFHEKVVKKCLCDAVNEFEKSYLRLVYGFWLK